MLPRVALTSSTAAAPLSAHVQGMTVYNTATAGSGATAVTPGYFYNDGTQWVRLNTEDFDWRKTGNLSPSAVGDTVGNIYHIGGYVGIGLNNPKNNLHICEPGQVTGLTSSYVSGITLTGTGNVAGGYTGPGMYFENVANAVGNKLMKFNYTSNNNGEGAINFQSVSDNAVVLANTPLTITHNAKVGINALNPNSSLQVGGSIAASINVVTASLSLTINHHTIIATTGGITITLPDPTTVGGRMYVLVNDAATNCNISSVIDFTGTATTALPANSSMIVQSSGTSWYRIQ